MITKCMYHILTTFGIPGKNRAQRIRWHFREISFIMYCCPRCLEHEKFCHYQFSLDMYPVIVYFSVILFVSQTWTATEFTRQRTPDQQSHWPFHTLSLTWHRWPNTKTRRMSFMWYMTCPINVNSLDAGDLIKIAIALACRGQRSHDDYSHPHTFSLSQTHTDSPSHTCTRGPMC